MEGGIGIHELRLSRVDFDKFVQDLPGTDA
jgi:hypothetical protein